jgi:hypothetical protein
LRNAQLYHQVPLVDALGALAARKQALQALPRRRLQTYAAIAVLALAAFTLIRWPLRVAGENPVLRPNGFTPVRVLVDGTIERIAVREGSRVARGDLVAVLRATPLAAERPMPPRPTGSPRSPPVGAIRRKSGSTASGARPCAGNSPCSTRSSA